MSLLGKATPDIQSDEDGIGDGGGTLFILTLRDLPGVRFGGRGRGGDDESSRLREKSDHFIVARKLSKDGGAKGVMCCKE